MSEATETPWTSDKFKAGFASVLPEATWQDLTQHNDPSHPEHDAVLFVVAWWCGHCRHEQPMINRMALLRDVQETTKAETPLRIPRVLWVTGTSEDDHGHNDWLQRLVAQGRLSQIPPGFPWMYVRVNGKFVDLPEDRLAEIRRNGSIETLLKTYKQMQKRK